MSVSHRIKKSIHCTVLVRCNGEGGERGHKDDAGPCEGLGVPRLPRKPGTVSGYVHVQRNNFNKQFYGLWQKTLIKPWGHRLLNVGSFKTPQERLP